MASSFLLSLSKPFHLSTSNSSSFPSLKPISSPPCLHTFHTSPHGYLSGLRKNALRVNAVTQKWEPTKVVPQADRVLIRLEELPQKSAGGVLLPKSAVKFERYLMGEVLAAGSEANGLETGKKVLFSDISAYEVDLGTDGRHCFCRASDLLAIVE